MDTAPPPNAPHPADDAQTARTRAAAEAERLHASAMATLDRLIDMGLEHAELTLVKARLPKSIEEAQLLAAETYIDHAASFARINRAIRIALLLRAHFSKKFHAAIAAAHAEQARAELDAAAERRESKRRRVHRAIARACGHQAAFRASSRFDDLDIIKDLEDQPIGDIVGKLCKEMGLDVPPDLQSPRPEEAREDAPHPSTSSRPGSIVTLVRPPPAPGSRPGSVPHPEPPD